MTKDKVLKLFTGFKIKTLDIKVNAYDALFVITFIRYAQNRKIGTIKLKSLKRIAKI
jgi:hypothetical protein